MPENRWELFPPRQVDFRIAPRQNARPSPRGARHEQTCRKQTEYRNRATSGDPLSACPFRAGLRVLSRFVSLFRLETPMFPEKAVPEDRDRAGLFGHRRW